MQLTTQAGKCMAKLALLVIYVHINKIFMEDVTLTLKGTVQ